MKSKILPYEEIHAVSHIVYCKLLFYVYYSNFLYHIFTLLPFKIFIFPLCEEGKGYFKGILVVWGGDGYKRQTSLIV